MNDNDKKVVKKQSGGVCEQAKYAFWGSIAYLVINLIQNFIYKETSGVLSVILEILAVVFFFGSIILGAISLEEIKKKALAGKKFAVMGIILPIVFFVLTLVIGIVANKDDFKEIIEQVRNCPNATDCVDNGDGTSTCLVNGEEFKCNDETLATSQFK